MGLLSCKPETVFVFRDFEACTLQEFEQYLASLRFGVKEFPQNLQERGEFFSMIEVKWKSGEKRGGLTDNGKYPLIGRGIYPF